MIVTARVSPMPLRHAVADVLKLDNRQGSQNKGNL
jgi:hypothetical protein